MTGIKNISSVGVDATLGDLGLDSLMGVEVKQTLERDYDLNLQMKEIRQLTFTKLREIATGGAASPTERAQSEEKAPPNLSNRYDLNEMVPSKTLVEMRTGDKTKPPLFVIHPIEGKNTVYLHTILQW